MTEDEENAATQRRIEGDRTVEHPPVRPADPAPAERGPSADADRQ
jgi:hypothetical protein